jgi:uncharacterized protein involved in type VI secretion and phage assembly
MTEKLTTTSNLSGILLGKVKQLDSNQESGLRLLVELTSAADETTTEVWARFASPHPTLMRSLPKAGDEVLLAFPDNAPDQPVIIGCLHSNLALTGSLIEVNEQTHSIRIADQHNNAIVMDSNGISLSTDKQLTLNTKGALSVNTQGNVSVESRETFTLKGKDVNVNAMTKLILKGMIEAEFSSSVKTTVKGAIVTIN